VKGRKILSVEKCRPAEKAKILKDFGIVVEDVSFAEVNAAYDRAPLDLARAKVAEWKRTARKVAGVSDETLLGSARMFYGMKNLLKERCASAISINCLGGCYHGKLKAYPCLGFMELQDLGLFGTCENDIRSTVTMMVFSAMTKGRMGYISDPCIDSSRRAVIFAHCVSTRKFLGVGDAAAPYEIETHCADRQGASVRTFAPKNMPVTTVQLHFGGGDVKGGILVQPGCIIGNDPDDRGCRTKIVAEMKGDFELVYRYWHTWGWHRVTFLGDFAKDAEALAKKLGYVCVYGM
jgi:L-fucose isomerase-like protein